MARPVFMMLVLVLATSAAHADERERASTHARRAVALYEVGRFDAALVEFEQAYVLYPTDTLLFNLAQTHRKLEHCHEAMELYRRLLDRNPDSERAPAVRRLLPSLEQACKVKDEAPRGVQVSDAEPAAARVAVASPPPPPPPTEGPATAEVEESAVAPARAPGRRLYAALAAGGLSASDGAVTPFGVAAGASWTTDRVPVEPGLLVTVAAHRWAGAGYRGSGSTIALLLTGGRGVRRPGLDLRVDVGAGATIVTGLGTGHPLLARGRRVPSGTITVPQLELGASGERMLGGGWRALAGVRAGAAHGGDTFGGAVLSFTVMLGIGRGL
jgi:hypothetical protein